MNDHDDMPLTALLRLRPEPVEVEGMAERIIVRAYAAPRGKTQIVRFPRRTWFADIAQALLLPRPAYAFGMILFCGAALGFSLGGVGDDGALGDWSNLLSSGEGWL